MNIRSSLNLNALKWWKNLFFHGIVVTLPAMQASPNMGSYIGNTELFKSNLLIPFHEYTAIPNDTFKSLPLTGNSISKNKKNRKRIKESLNEAKLNGEAIVLHLEIPESAYNKNPDTIRHFLQAEYQAQRVNFPTVAVEDENGSLKELILLPKLSYRILLFEDAYTKRPYQTQLLSVRQEEDLIIVE